MLALLGKWVKYQPNKKPAFASFFCSEQLPVFRLVAGIGYNLLGSGNFFLDFFYA